MELVKMSDIQSGKQSSTPSSGIVPMASVSKGGSSGLIPMSQVAVRAPAADPSESIDAILQSQHGAEQSVGAAPQPYGTGPYLPDKSAWNGWLDNPIVHGAETGMKSIAKPFEAISAGAADLYGFLNNHHLISSDTGAHQQQNLDGTTTNNYPSQPRNYLKDFGNIFSNMNEHVSSDAWHGAVPNLNKMPGTSADWADVLDFGAQSLPFGELAAPFKVASKAVGLTKSADSQAFKQAIDEFIQRTKAPDAAEIPSSYSAAARQGLVQEAPKSITPMKDLQTGQDLAATFDRGEKYKQAYQQAVNDQHAFLKQSMENRGGVDQGGMIKDPTTGEVVNRYGRISNNPPWYQDFFKENGKKPSDAELRALAEQHVKEGFNDVGGRIPPWKPDEFHNIDEEIKHINELLPHADPQTAASLQETVKTLEQSRGEYGRSLPEGIQANMARKPLPELTDNHLTPLNTYSDTLYRETSPSRAIEMIPGSNTYTDTVNDHVYFSNNKDLAIGQGTNKGVLIEMDSKGLQGQVDRSKPSWDVSYKNGDAEFIGKYNHQGTYQDAVKSVTIKPDATMDKVTKARLQRTLSSWEQVKNPDGSVTFLRPKPEPLPGASSSITKEAFKKMEDSGEYFIRTVRTPLKDLAGRTSTPAGKTGIELGLSADTHKGLSGFNLKDQKRMLEWMGKEGWEHENVAVYKGKPTKEQVVLDKGEVEFKPSELVGYVPTKLFKEHGGDFHEALLKHTGIEKPSAAIQPMSDIQAMRSTGQVMGEAPKQPRTIETAAAQENVQNYAGNQMPFRQAATQTDRSINRNEVIANIRKNLRVTIDTGRMGMGKGVLGIYKTTPEVVRSGMAEDLQTISHEVGHHLDKKFNLQDPRFQGELNQLMQASGHNMAAYQPHQLGAEGVAEFVRLYVTDRAEAFKQAPNFAKHFESTLPSRVLKGLEATTKDINTWITQGPENQAKGLVDFDTSKPKPSIFSWNKFYTHNIDDLNPIKLAEKALTGKVGFGKDSIYKMARLTRGIAERAKLALTDGIYINGTKVSDGLQQIVKPLEDAGLKERDFATYLAVKHAIDLKALNKRVPFTDEQIKAIMQKFDTPMMQQAQQKIIQFNNSLLDILVEAGIKSAQDVAALRAKYPNYVPFMRHFDDDALAGFKNGGFGAAKAFANITDPVKKMSEEGSFRTIINPVESMAKNAFLTMNAAAKNKVGLQLAELSKIDGAGKWVEKVPGTSSPHEHVVNVWENGDKQAYKIAEPELYNAMLTLDHESSTSLIRFLGGAAGMLRAGSTLTPEFMLRNAMRDTMEAFIKVGMNPIDFAKGLFHVLGKTDTFNRFLSEGGAMGTMMALDREALQRDAMSKIFRESLKDKALNVITSPKELAKMITGITPAKKVIGVLRHGAEISELSTKVGTFQKVLKKTGSAEEAAYTARDLMDFNSAGSNIRQANRAIAFLNSSIQGTDGLIRAFKQNPAGYAVRAFTALVLPAMGAYYWNKNLPADKKALYDNIPQWQKDSFFVVNLPGTDKFLRIPKPFEAGALFATGTERLLRWFDGHDPEASKGYGTTLLSSFTPPILFTTMTPLLEAITNHSFFKNTPIVSQTYNRFEKVDQSDPIKTSETAKLIGQAANAVGLGKTNAASPLIIDNTIHGYTGGLGQYAISGLDKVLHSMGVGGDITKPAKNWNESSFVAPFFATTSGGGQIRQQFYSKWDDLSSAKASADRNEVPFNDPLYESMKAAKSYIDTAMKQYKVIQKDKNMNSADKRTQLDRLDGIMNTAAAHALGK